MALPLTDLAGQILFAKCEAILAVVTFFFSWWVSFAAPSLFHQRVMKFAHALFDEIGHVFALSRFRLFREVLGCERPKWHLRIIVLSLTMLPSASAKPSPWRRGRACGFRHQSAWI